MSRPEIVNTDYVYDEKTDTLPGVPMLKFKDGDSVYSLAEIIFNQKLNAETILSTVKGYVFSDPFWNEIPDKDWIIETAKEKKETTIEKTGGDRLRFLSSYEEEYKNISKEGAYTKDPIFDHKSKKFREGVFDEDGFLSDRIFGDLRVAGPNPIFIRKVTGGDGLNLDGAPEDFRQTVTGAVDGGGLYVLDYSRLTEPLMDKDGTVDITTRKSKQGTGTQKLHKYTYPSTAYFSAEKDENTGKNHLKPIAISYQIPSKSDDSGAETCYIVNPAISGGGADSAKEKILWGIAKAVVQVADAIVHESIAHLGQTHLFLEPCVISTERCLPDSHPLYMLLRPHFEGTIFINTGAQINLVAKGGPVDHALSPPIEDVLKLAVGETYGSGLFNYQSRMLHNDLKNRGMDSADVDYPYRDCAVGVHGEISKWVKGYIERTYPDDSALSNDRHMGSWIQDLRENGHIDVDMETVGSRAGMADFVAHIIFTASAQHAAVNFPQRTIMAYVPAQPVGCYSYLGGLREKSSNELREKYWQYMMPPIQEVAEQFSTLSLLGSVHYTNLGNYTWEYTKGDYKGKRLKDFLEDKSSVGPLEDFQRGLGRLDFLKASDMRYLAGFLPYEYLIPKHIPQSINI